MGGVALAAPADDVVLLDVGATAHAAVTEDALVVVDVDSWRRVVLPPLEGSRPDRLAAGEGPLRLDGGGVGHGIGGMFERPSLDGQGVEPLREPAQFVGRQPCLPVGREMVGGQQIDERPNVGVDPLAGRQVR